MLPINTNSLPSAENAPEYPPGISRMTAPVAISVMRAANSPTIASFEPSREITMARIA